MAYRLGDMPLGQLLSVATGVFRDHYRMLLWATAMICMPFFAIYFMAVYGNMFARLNQLLGHEIFSWRSSYWISYILALALWFASWVVLSGALSFIAASRYIGIPLSPRDGLRRCRECGLGLAVTTVFVAPIVFLFFLLWGGLSSGLPYAIAQGSADQRMAVAIFLYAIGFAVFGCMTWLLVRYLLVFAVVVLERLYGRRALQRSAQLMRGSYHKGIVLWVGYTLASMAASAVMSAVASLYVAWLISAAISYAAFAFFSTAVAVLYVSARCKHESFDLALQQVRSGA